MSIKAEVDPALQRVGATNRRHVVDELKRADAARVVREVSVWRRRVHKRKWKSRIGSRGSEGEKVFAKTEDRFVRQSRGRRPAPVNGEVLRSATRVDEVWRVRENRTSTICRIAEGALTALSITNVKQTVVAQVEIKLTDEVILLFMLRRTEVETGCIQTIAYREIVRQRHRVEVTAQRRVETYSGVIGCDVVGSDAGFV